MKNENTDPATESNSCLAAQGDGVEGLAGRELDALIAERAMEWTWWSFANVSFLVPPYLAKHFGEHPAIGWRKKRLPETTELAAAFPTDYGHVRLPHYSTDIAAAMEVVEKMRERFPRVQITTHENLEGAWYIEFDDVNDGTRPDSPCSNAICDTLPEAICLAALQVAGGFPSRQ